MLQLRINQYFGRIGIDHVPSKLEISCPMSVMEIRQELGQMEMERVPPAVKIDLKEAFGDLGMKKPDQLAQEALWMLGRRIIRLDRVVAEGDRLSRIELGGPDGHSPGQFQPAKGAQYDRGSQGSADDRDGRGRFFLPL